MWIATKKVKDTEACSHCNSKFVIVHSENDNRLYGEFCSAECQQKVKGTTQPVQNIKIAKPIDIHRPSPIQIPEPPYCSPARMIASSF